jgi:hypothetical protein
MHPISEAIGHQNISPAQLITVTLFVRTRTMNHPRREFPTTATVRSWQRRRTTYTSGSNARRRSLQVAGHHVRPRNRTQSNPHKNTPAKTEAYTAVRALAGKKELIRLDRKQQDRPFKECRGQTGEIAIMSGLGATKSVATIRRSPFGDHSKFQLELAS